MDNEKMSSDIGNESNPETPSESAEQRSADLPLPPADHLVRILEEAGQSVSSKQREEITALMRDALNRDISEQLLQVTGLTREQLGPALIREAGEVIDQAKAEEFWRNPVWSHLDHYTTVRSDLSVAGEEITSEPTKLQEIVRQIQGHSGRGKLGQGYFWNVWVSSESQYVVKLPARDETIELLQPDELASMEQHLGEFLVPQVAVANPETGGIIIVQEKIDTADPVSEHLDDLETASFAHDQTRDTLRRFVEGVKEVGEAYSDKILDLLGTNLFFDFDDEGRLRLQMPDTGMIPKSQLGEEQLFEIEETLHRLEAISRSGEGE